MLQIFLFVNAFLIGVLTAVGARHAYAHFRPARPTKSAHPTLEVALPEKTKEQLLQEATDKLKHIVDHSADEFQHSLRSTATQLNTQLEHLGGEIVTNEMNRYRLSLDELREQAKAAFASAENDITTHQAELEKALDARRKELEAKLAEEIAAEKAKLISQMDAHLSDAVVSFILETMGHNVDLGAQTAYLTSVLEENKEQLKKEVTDGS
jgi:hypothetical protein